MTARGALVLALVVGCGRPDVIAPTVSTMPPHARTVLDASPKASRRAVAAEARLRAYLLWFGDVGPREAFDRARGDELFDRWSSYLAALGLPDYHVDLPRVSRSNTLMLAALGRIGEALCIRSVERDLRGAPLADRVIFAFEPQDNMNRAGFAVRFDVLHRTFLGYPAALAPPDRIDRYYALYTRVARRAATGKLAPAELGWAAVCAALVQHPEAGLY